jgi:hypothetical protein
MKKQSIYLIPRLETAIEGMKQWIRKNAFRVRVHA